MMYRGKVEDGFDYTINALFASAGSGRIFSADCASQRTVALSASQNPEECFCPVFGWREYMSRLSANLGIVGAAQCLKFDADALEQMEENTLFMLGEVAIPEWDVTPIHKLRRRNRVFLLCEKKHSRYAVINPTGSSLSVMSPNELSALSAGYDSFLFFLSGKVQLKPKSKLELLKLSAETELSFNEVPSLSNLRVDFQKSKEKILFQNALLRYLIRRTKTAEFFSMSRELHSALSNVSVQRHFNSFESISYAERVFRRELGKAFG